MINEFPLSDSKVLASEFFRREDESDDKLFYTEPRLTAHIDEHAVSSLKEYFSNTLPPNGVILDLMSSWRSHLPEGLSVKRVVGLGLNAIEMAENPQLDEWVIHDLNFDSRLPFEDKFFDVALVTVSIQYMVRPVDVFTQVNRVLREGASFHVIFSNRMFFSKAVQIWRMLDDTRRAKLTRYYFEKSGGWEAIHETDISPKLGFYTDPLCVVSARKVNE